MPSLPNVETSYAPLRNAARSGLLLLCSQFVKMAQVRHVAPPAGRMAFAGDALNGANCPPAHIVGTSTHGMGSGRLSAAFMNSTHWPVDISYRPILNS
ncbi:MAG: hypothetical protein WAZ94_07690 [Phycisphaerales bacterium]